nr:uncharacterized protein LOC133575273 isoform X2 [Nerophis lumbriciformis]
MSSVFAVLTVFSTLGTSVYSIQRCGFAICRDDQECCPRGNATASEGTCCNRLEDKTYYHVAMIQTAQPGAQRRLGCCNLSGAASGELHTRQPSGLWNHGSTSHI